MFHSVNKERIPSLFALFLDSSYCITMISLFCQVEICIRLHGTEMTGCFETLGSGNMKYEYIRQEYAHSNCILYLNRKNCSSRSDLWKSRR